MDVVTTTLWLTLGITYYQAEPGASLACPGHVYTVGQEWAALPIEWNQSGWVNCGDTVLLAFSNGTTWRGPVWDFGCHLHYSPWDSPGPFGADLPMHLAKQLPPTSTGQLTVVTWTQAPPLTAWWSGCDGPLTAHPTRQEERRYWPE